MAIGQLLKFIGGARQLAKLDPATAFPGQTITSDQLRCHRILIRAGVAGALVGALFGIWFGIELYLHPDTSSPDGGTMLMAFVAAPLMTVVGGILGGVSWAGVFLPTAFFNGPLGAHWMKFSGARGPTSARVVAAITAMLAIGLLLFLCICVRLGKI
jgi:hypothetical protein